MANYGWKSSAWLPIGFSVGTLLGSILVYAIAVGRGDQDAFLPFISNAGGQPPESGIFGLVLFFASIFANIILFLHYLKVSMVYGVHNAAICVLNKIALIVGIVSICGMVIVANYPVGFVRCVQNSTNGSWYRDQAGWKKDVLIPHIIGAMTLFFGMLVYMIIQTIVTFLSKSWTLLWIRLAIVTFGFISLIVMMTFKNASILDADIKSGSFPGNQLFEWLLAFSFIAYIGTFFQDLKTINVSINIAHSEAPYDIHTGDSS